jgi:S1-C subfamily serine protease
MGALQQHRRAPRWSLGLLAIAAVLGLALGSVPPAQASPVDLIAPSLSPSASGLDLLREAPADPVDPSATLAQVAPTIVDINTTLNYQSAQGAGTGIVLNPTGEVLTNNHVIEGATSITATSIGNGHSYPVDVIGYDRSHDIALVQLRGATDLIPAALGDSSRVAIGDPIVAIGNAGGVGGAPTPAPGKVTALNQRVTATDDVSGDLRSVDGLIQVAADIRPGDSGGPLVNGGGQVIGVNTAASDGYQMGTRVGQGFAIPIGTALDIATQIRSGAPSGSVHIGDTAFLGVGITNDDRTGSGARISQVLRGTPAEQIGLAPGDLIVSVDGTNVDSPTTLTNLFDHRHPGDNIRLGWVDRAGRPHDAPVTLAVGPVG